MTVRGRSTFRHTQPPTRNCPSHTGWQGPWVASAPTQVMSHTLFCLFVLVKSIAVFVWLVGLFVVPGSQSTIDRVHALKASLGYMYGETLSQ